MKILQWLKYFLVVFMCIVKYVWLAVRIPLSLPVVGIILFCFIIALPIWFVMACITDNSADELIADFKNWYLGPAEDYLDWCCKTFDSYKWTRPAQELLVNFPRED